MPEFGARYEPARAKSAYEKESKKHSEYITLAKALGVERGKCRKDMLYYELKLKPFEKHIHGRAVWLSRSKTKKDGKVLYHYTEECFRTFTTLAGRRVGEEYAKLAGGVGHDACKPSDYDE